MNLKKALLIMLIALLAAASVFATGEQETGAVKIGISKLLAHPALDAIEEAIIETVKASGHDVVFETQNANGEISTAASIAQLFKTEGMDLVVGIATPTAQALANVFDDIPVVFATVTDVVAAGLDGLPNVAGTSDEVPIEEHYKLIQTLTGAKSVGMVYTANEANGLSAMERMKAVCEADGTTFVGAAVQNSAEVRMAAQSIVDRVDAMYVAIDNTVISAVSALADVCNEKNVPLVSADTTSAFGTNVLIACGFDYYAAGVLTGELVNEILDGATPEEIGTWYLTGLEYYINLDVAEAIGLEIPDEVMAKAEYIIKDGVEQ